MKTISPNTVCTGWVMKTSHFNPHDFVVQAIDNYVLPMKDGFNQFVEVIPPQPIEGVLSLKVVRHSDRQQLNLLIQQETVTLMKQGITYNEGLEVLKQFSVNALVPSLLDCIEVPNDPKYLRTQFRALARLLIGNDEAYKRFVKRVKISTFSDCEKMWLKLHNFLIEIEQIYHMDWKIEQAAFYDSVLALFNSFGLPPLQYQSQESSDASDWSRQVNNQLPRHILVNMETGGDSYSLLILPKENYEAAKEIAEQFLQKLAPLGE